MSRGRPLPTALESEEEPLIATVLRLASLVATGVVLCSFVLFVVDESRAGSSEQVARVDSSGSAPPVASGTALDQPNPPPAVRRVRAHRDGRLREVIDRGDDFLLAPFTGVARSDSIWVERVVPGLLAVLLFGVGLRFLAGYAGLARR